MKKAIRAGLAIYFCVGVLHTRGQAWRDAEWRHPAIYQDLYEQNFWDPEFSANHNRSPARSFRTLRGTLQTFRHIRLENAVGLQEKHWIGKMKLTELSSVIVDFGPSLPESLRGSLLESVIQVRGRIGRIQGRRVLFARELRANGQTWSR